MPLASWIVASHHRPELLAATLPTLAWGRWPKGWEYEVVVACHAQDPDSQAVAAACGARVVSTAQPHPSGKRNAALEVCRGELVLTTDDDDFQSPLRPAMAVSAFAAGYKVSGIREFRRLHTATGMVVRYCGRGGGLDGEIDLPPVYCGTARNYCRDTLVRKKGWRADLPSLEDTELHKRLIKRGGAGAAAIDLDLGAMLADTTIVLQHDKNIFARPDIRRGRREVHGEYLLVGEGHYTELPTFPPAVAARLRGILT